MASSGPAPLTRLRVAARTDRGEYPDDNQDAFVVVDMATGVRFGPRLARRPLARPAPPTDPASLTLENGVGAALAVIDGMGHLTGDIAAHLAADAFVASLAMAPPSGEEAYRERVVDALQGASRAVFEDAERHRHHYGNAASAVLAVVSGDRLHLANVGETRAYLLRGERLVQVTRDDSLVNDYLAHAAGAGLDVDISQIPTGVVTKVLGMTELLEVHPSTFGLRAGDVILLATDGLTGVVADAEIERILLDLSDPDEACLALIDLATRRSRDNITVVVARPEGDLRARRISKS